jgi:ABC-type polysaccharide/polyol phosphate export permease
MDPVNPAQAPAGAPDLREQDGGWVTAQAPRAVEVVSRIATFPRLCNEYRDLIRTSVRRELQARFTGTTLGWLWPLLQPLLLFLVYYFIFTKLLGFKFKDNLPAGQEAAFGIFMFVGVVVWGALADSILRGCGSIVDNGNLIKKLAFPSEVLPLNVVLVSMVTMLFAVAMFIVAAVATPIWEAPGPMLLWIPVLVLIQGLFTLGLVLFLAALQVFLRDTLQVMGVVTTVWMFLTPIFWTPEVIEPRSVIEPYLWLVEGNPMYHIVYAWRVVLMSSEPAFAYTHSFGASMAIFGAWALGLFVVGYAFFILCQRRFADEV